MLVWLASYPRSGNSLVRRLLESACGVTTYSIYDENERNAAHAPLRSLEPVLVKCAAADAYCFVKTHAAPPPDAERAIYVLRDGRSAVVSYTHYLADIAKDPHSLEDVLSGDVTFGGWSAHVQAWAPRQRPGTLLLRYEDLVHAPAACLEQIHAFLPRLIPTGQMPEPFAVQHAANPTFFRAGSDAANVAEMLPAQRALFAELHGATMREYDYPMP